MNLEARLFWKDDQEVFHPVYEPNEPVAVLCVNVYSRSKSTSRDELTPEATIEYLRIAPRRAVPVTGEPLFAIAYIKGAIAPAECVEIIFPGRNPRDKKGLVQVFCKRLILQSLFPSL